MKLYQLINIMEQALENLRNERINYPKSCELEKFIKWKEQDLKEFKLLVGTFKTDAFVPDVVSELKVRKVNYKFLGMTQRPKEYFNITKKLQKLLDEGY